MKVSLVLPVLNPGAYAERMADALLRQSRRPDEFLVVDSESTDGSVDAYRTAGAEVMRIARREFDHGGTRNAALERVEGDVVVFLTQDAVLADENALERLLGALDAGHDVAAAYGRHVPPPGSGAVAAHVRLFNYPEVSALRSARDFSTLGVRAAFCSNAFSAWRRDALRAVGGFPVPLIMGEDMCAAAKLLLAGWRVAYAADACVWHVHEYSPLQEFRLLFDTGVLHSAEPWLLDLLGAPYGEGGRFARSELRYLRTHGVTAAVLQWLLRNGLRYGGYQLGRMHRALPRAACRRFSTSAQYWARL